MPQSEEISVVPQHIHTEECNDHNNLCQWEFILLFIVIIFSWIIISLWGKVIENFSYITMGMERQSTWNALIIAITITLVFILIVYYMGEKGKMVQNKLIGMTVQNPKKNKKK